MVDWKRIRLIERYVTALALIVMTVAAAWLVTMFLVMMWHVIATLAGA